MEPDEVRDGNLLNVGLTRAIDHLAVANETGAYQVTAHLADGHGYASICFIAGPPDSPDSARRLDGFRRAQIYAGQNFNLSSFTVLAFCYVVITFPMTRFTDRLLRRDQERLRVGGR